MRDPGPPRSAPAHERPARARGETDEHRKRRSTTACVSARNGWHLRRSGWAKLHAPHRRDMNGPHMPTQSTRRDILRGGLAVTGLALLDMPEWALPALAQGEVLVPFTDMPENFPTVTGADRRIIDIRKIDGPFTPKDQFFTTQHYGHPVIDPAAFRLKVSGTRRAAAVALARRAPADAQRRARRRLRVLGQSASAAGPVAATDAGPASRCARCSIARA